MTKSKDDLGDRVRVLLKRLQLTQDAMAEALWDASQR